MIGFLQHHNGHQWHKCPVCGYAIRAGLQWHFQEFCCCGCDTYLRYERKEHGMGRWVQIGAFTAREHAS